MIDEVFVYHSWWAHIILEAADVENRKLSHYIHDMICTGTLALNAGLF